MIPIRGKFYHPERANNILPEEYHYWPSGTHESGAGLTIRGEFGICEYKDHTRFHSPEEMIILIDAVARKNNMDLRKYDKIVVEQTEVCDEMILCIGEDGSLSVQEEKPSVTVEPLGPGVIICLDTSEVDQSWSLRRIGEEMAPIGWPGLFDGYGNTLDHIEKLIGQNFVPLKCDIFNALHWTPLSDVKVLILGQDPYHTLLNDGTPQAVGASFSLRRNAPLQPSVKNIYKEIAAHDPTFMTPQHGDLRRWANQGVLLLNACLTTVPGKAGAHGVIWNGLIIRILEKLREQRPNSIVMLWGKPAQSYASRMGRMNLLPASHPSPFSYKRGFEGCDHFRLANDLLIKNGMTPIDWNVD